MILILLFLWKPTFLEQTDLPLSHCTTSSFDEFTLITRDGPDEVDPINSFTKLEDPACSIAPSLSSTSTNLGQYQGKFAPFSYFSSGIIT